MRPSGALPACNRSSFKSGAGVENCERCPGHSGTSKAGAETMLECDSCAMGYTEGKPLPLLPLWAHMVCAVKEGFACADTNGSATVIDAENATQCCERCQDTANCNSWTWNGRMDPHQPQGDKKCWLRERCAALLPNQTATSGDKCAGGTCPALAFLGHPLWGSP